MGNLLSIRSIMGWMFRIPSFPRGYRWGRLEVEALLDDLWSFCQSKQKGDFYCLQPIALREEKGEYIVLDGQQRLTTIFLLLTLLEDRRKEDYSSTELFALI